MKPAPGAAGKGRGTAPAAAKPTASRRGSLTSKAAPDAAAAAASKSAVSAAPSAVTSPAGPSKPAAPGGSPGRLGRGKAPAGGGTPTPAKAEVLAAAAAAAGKAPPPPAAAAAPAAAACPADAAKLGAAAAAKAAQAAERADAFIYEEYGFPSAAEPLPAANPLLIFSVLVSYFLFVAACFLIIKYAYHGYDVNAPDVHTVTSKDIHAKLEFDPKDLEDNKPPSARRFASFGRVKRKGSKKPVRTRKVRRRSTSSAWENERVTMMAADVDYLAEVLGSRVAVEGAGLHQSAKTTVHAKDADGSGNDAAPSSPGRPSVRPKNLNKSG
ncbi:uncharacterized protein [Dermacentor andersoni]|uniref:uncharacterized protein n=1 Tax=Dermacentor andersoni TaxID=34620 RepID=UPI0024176C25|nr:forkhead box protein I3-like [Dermacentor andersoni]